jgi:hypothetical protein
VHLAAHPLFPAVPPDAPNKAQEKPYTAYEQSQGSVQAEVINVPPTYDMQLQAWVSASVVMRSELHVD